MSLAHQFWKGRRVRVAGALDQVAVASRDDLAAIYRDYGDVVYRRCYGTLKDHEAALDATQDVFLHALGCFEDIQHDVVRGLVDLARTLAYERKRRPAREVAFAEPRRAGRGADDPVEIAERHDVLDAVWASLSPLERRYLADKVAGFSFKEIAQRNRRALGTVSSNLAHAREHARKVREPMLPAVLGAGAWRRFTELTRRVRAAAHSSSVAAAAQPVQALTLSLTLTGLLAGVAPMAPAAAAVPVGAWVRSGASAPGAALSVNRSGADAWTAPMAFTGGGQPALAPDSQPPAPRSGVLAIASPNAETPEDTRLMAATPSPHYAQDSTILALGWGRSCVCHVLLRSSDGGASWTARPGPPDGDQLVLPPDYPRDPRIFVGYAVEVPGATNYWTPSFGSPFSPLTMPAGAMALAAGFDSGDQRVVVSSRNGIFGLDWATGVVRPLLFDTDFSDVPAITAPRGAASTGMLAITSTAAMTAVAPAPALNSSSELELWACPPRQQCQTIGSVPLNSAANLVTSPRYAADHSVLAYTRTHVVLSRDSGSSFQPVALPPGTVAVDGVMVGFPSGGGTPIWMLVQRDLGFSLEFASSPNGPWKDVDQGLPQITDGFGRLIPLGPGRVVYLSATRGLMCTANDGLSWSTRCPIA